ncbi:helix-turn-helix transcriptional regulator [Lactiplantibacillus daowaiensis]|uniref:Helix-turn-helix transcriptional regulator n=1 Tax=Lactiplantibacillus daowaiensis TaxID=2559918 RepID=A0ABW1RXR1_9LACO|nr:WYL domain-containing protein [Lactiplantibacillus daowaiensis]
MNSNERIIKTFIRLLRGKAVGMTALATEYQVTARTMQRDLASIRDLLAASDLGYSLDYQRSTKQYTLTHPSQVQVDTVLALLKILVGTRSLNATELQLIITQQLALLSPTEQSLVQKMLTPSLVKYLPVGTGTALLPRLKQMAQWIDAKTTLSFTYRNSVAGKLKTGQGLPVSLYFADFYFYAVIYTAQDVHVVYRVDRFETVAPTTTKKLKLRYDRKLDAGEFTNKTYLLSGGDELTYTFRYWAHPQTALDRLPHSKIVKRYADGSVAIRADSFEQGTLLWLLSQGSQVQVLTPPRLVETVRQELTRALRFYPVPATDLKN